MCAFNKLSKIQMKEIIKGLEEKGGIRFNQYSASGISLFNFFGIETPFDEFRISKKCTTEESQMHNDIHKIMRKAGFIFFLFFIFYFFFYFCLFNIFNLFLILFIFCS